MVAENVRANGHGLTLTYWRTVGFMVSALQKNLYTETKISVGVTP